MLKRIIGLYTVNSILKNVSKLLPFASKKACFSRTVRFTRFFETMLAIEARPS